MFRRRAEPRGSRVAGSAANAVGVTVRSSLSRWEGAKLSRRTNYSFGKRQKELKRAQKQQQKQEERRAKKAGQAGETTESSEPVDSGEPQDGADTEGPPTESESDEEPEEQS